MRLPTETEWEYAARGPESLVWPWGNEFDANNLVYKNNSEYKPAVVGSRLGGASWVGALDLSGNVAEWCLSAWGEDYTSLEDNHIHRIDSPRVLRGGSFSSSHEFAACASRSYDDPRLDGYLFGVRLVLMAPVSAL